MSHDSIEDIDRLILDVGKANVKGGVFAVCSKGVLSFVKGEMLENSTIRSVNVSGEGVYQFGNREIEFKIYPFDGKIANVHKKFANHSFFSKKSTTQLFQPCSASLQLKVKDEPPPWPVTVRFRTITQKG